MSQNAYLLLK